ncbi:MAG: type I-U CRISPR-associated RAMP protein Csb1/Cas7u [Bryobacterales bacterium]|nr:type I-U CRISPR-associated RAMP protein Csb1/Cas7u [Bryobacteraceae bacterium]MDW8355153.1 type I-U CRISPR-associated RAMP protein Csb1/Cas7u [Bryobacterales bacterium]
MSGTLLTVSETILDEWATKPDGPVALRLKQRLLPVEDSQIIFPPTYADIGYNIDTLSDNTRVVTVDSVGSQANRLEPIFKSESKDPRDWLVPQIEIIIREEPCGECPGCRKAQAGGSKSGNKSPCTQPREVTRSLLDLPHRAADAVVQASPDLLKIVAPAFKALQQGDAGPLCAIAPTSLVFGVWDSRGETGEKRPRLVRSIIRAWDVELLHAAAQFNSVWKLLDEEQKETLQKEAKAKKVELSEMGFKDAPAVFRQISDSQKVPQYRDGAPNPEARVLGGVLVKGRVERDVTVNLVALRGLRGADEQESKAIRKYLLGLTLMTATADMELFLREGCLLRYAEDGDRWYQVPRRGEPAEVTLVPDTVRAYATQAAAHFRAKWPEVFHHKWPADGRPPVELKYRFDINKAKELLAKKTQGEEPGAEKG